MDYGNSDNGYPTRSTKSFLGSTRDANPLNRIYNIGEHPNTSNLSDLEGWDYLIVSFSYKISRFLLSKK